MSRPQAAPAPAKPRKRAIPRQRMGVQDALWLEMDRPSNLMVVDSLIWTAEPIDWDRFVTVIRQRLWDRFPVFRSVAVGGDDGDWYWEEHHGDTFESHVTRVRLTKPGGDLELQELVASQRTTPLDRSRPLWQVFCVDGFKGGSAVLFRTHHAIADGVRMVQLGMSLFDATSEGGAILAPAVQLHAAHLADTPRPLLDQLRHEASALVEEVTDLAGDAAEAVSRAITDPGGVARAGVDAIGEAINEASRIAGRTIEVAGTALTNPVGAAHGIATAAADGVEHAVRRLQSAMQPRLPGHGPLVDMLSSSPGDIDFARKLLLGTRNDPTYWTGEVGPHKVVAWSPPLSLDAVKQVARTHDATVNDVLVTCVAGTLHTYLTNHGSACASVNWMIPVNLKPLDRTLPEQLGNSFAIVQLELPTDIADPLVVLDVVKRRMGRIKHGHEAGLAFRLQEVISGFSEVLYRAAVDLLANRAVGVLTNVPGPPMPVYMAGQRIEGMVGWAPLSGNQPMSFTIYSYDAKVFVGIACDAGLVPDHHQIVDGFADAFQRLSVAVR